MFVPLSSVYARGVKLLRFRNALAVTRRDPAKAVVFGAAVAYLKAFRTRHLAAEMHRIENWLTLQRDQSNRLERLLGDSPLRYLDVGARGGPDPRLQRYRRFFRFTLVEPDPDEAVKLRAQGYDVCEDALGAEDGSALLNLTRWPGSSSLLDPHSRWREYTNSDHDFLEILSRPTVSVTTIDKLVDRMGHAFEGVKLDTQGTEGSILRGMTGEQPFLILTEVSLVELYREQETFPALAARLYELGYVVADLQLREYLPDHRDCTEFGARVSPGLPLHGDALFVPDWASDAGRAIIERDLARWSAIWLAFGREELVRFVIGKVGNSSARAEVRRILDA